MLLRMDGSHPLWLAGTEIGTKDLLLNGALFAHQNRDRLMYINETANWLVFSDYGWFRAAPGEEARAARL